MKALSINLGVRNKHHQRPWSLAVTVNLQSALDSTGKAISAPAANKLREVAPRSHSGSEEEKSVSLTLGVKEGTKSAFIKLYILKGNVPEEREY